MPHATSFSSVKRLQGKGLTPTRLKNKKREWAEEPTKGKYHQTWCPTINPTYFCHAPPHSTHPCRASCHPSTHHLFIWTEYDDDDIGAVFMVVLVSICRCPLSHASQLHRFVHCDLFLAIPSTSLHRFYVKTFGSIFCWYRTWQRRGFYFWELKKVQRHRRSIDRDLRENISPSVFLRTQVRPMPCPVSPSGSFPIDRISSVFLLIQLMAVACRLKAIRWGFDACYFSYCVEVLPFVTFFRGVQSVRNVWRSCRFEFCLHIWSFTPRPHSNVIM